MNKSEKEYFYFKKIFDFNQRQAIKLNNSSYLEDLTGLFEAVSSRIDEGKDYYFDDQYYLSNPNFEPNSSYSEFIKSFKNSFFYGDNGKIHIIRGRAGVGKTLFFERGIQKLLRNNVEHQDRYIPLGVDFKNIDSKKSISFYSKQIYETLNKNAIDAIRLLGEEYFKQFQAEYRDFRGDLNNLATNHTALFPLLFFCKKIFDKYSRPCIIIFDNIDLACVETQKNVFKATANVCEQINAFMRSYHFGRYCIYFAMRPETYLCREEAKLGDVINFPLPNILRITLKTIESSLMSISKEFDKNNKLKCEVDYYDIIDNKLKHASTFSDIAYYFNNVLTYYLSDVWEENDSVKRRLGTSEDFHCYIVNYNVRNFFSFLADTLGNGGFKPLTKSFNELTNTHFYTIYDYIEMLIRGRWIVHPGNRFINSEGGNKAPIVFNVFDTNLWTNTQESKIKHFMLFVRILQYFCLISNEEKIFYCDLKNCLCPFFDETHIQNAVKKLIHVRILYSFFQGDTNIASINHWKDICIDDTTELKISPTGIFYLQNLICEFEYIYQMALSSLMPEIYVTELKDKWQNEKELTVFYFLKGIFLILKNNIREYNGEKRCAFIATFCQDSIMSFPYKRMLNSFIAVMENKIQRAESLESKRLDKLLSIKNDAQELSKEVEKYFFEELEGFS